MPVWDLLVPGWELNACSHLCRGSADDRLCRAEYV